MNFSEFAKLPFINQLKELEDADDSSKEAVLRRQALNNFNKGYISFLQDTKNDSSRKELLKELLKQTPENFSKSEIIDKFIQEVLNNVNSEYDEDTQKLSIDGADVLIKLLRSTIKTAYSCGLSSGFNIASDKVKCDTYLNSMEAFNS
jgi:hypothetical protein